MNWSIWPAQWLKICLQSFRFDSTQISIESEALQEYSDWITKWILVGVLLQYFQILGFQAERKGNWGKQPPTSPVRRH
jgi:hypothetical protein